MRKIILAFTLMLSFHSEASFLEAFQLEIGTQLPTQLSMRARGYFTPEIYFVGGLGYMPSFYGGIAESMGFNSAKENKPIIKEGLSDSVVLDVRGGYYWHSDFPLYIEVGYMMISGGSGELTGDQVNDFDYSFNNHSSYESFKIESSIHALTLNLAYPYHATNNLSLIFEMGMTKPIASTNNFDGRVGYSTRYNSTDEKDFEEEMAKVWKKVVFVNLGLYAAVNF